MIDFMKYCLQVFNKETDWNENNYYSTLCAASNEIIDFKIPVGCNVSIGKSISPQLKSNYTLGLPNKRSIGFLFTSIEQNLSPVKLGYETQNAIKKENFGNTSFYSIKPEKINNTKIITFQLRSQKEKELRRLKEIEEEKRRNKEFEKKKYKSYLLCGRLYEDLHLEGLFCKRFNKNTLFASTSIIPWYANQKAVINNQLFYCNSRFCNELSFLSDKNLFGLNSLFKVNDHWSMGGELYLSKTGGGVGMSVGARYMKQYAENVTSILTLVSNPFMGYLSSSYTTTLAKGMFMSTRYDFNVYSYDSDLAVGVEYSPENKNQLIKAKISLKDGISVMLEGIYKKAKYSLGFMTGFGKQSSQSLGLEVAFS